jgi:hypothetical protein
MRAMGDGLFVPKGCRVFTIKPDEDEDEDDEYGAKYCPGKHWGSKPPPILPGTEIDLQRAIYDKTAELKIHHSGSHVQVNGREFDPVEGLIHLVRDHGLRPDKAKLILKEAKEKRVVRCRVKYAQQSYPLQHSAPAAPGFPDPVMSTDPLSMTGVPSTRPMERFLPVNLPLPRPERWNNLMPPDPQTMQTAMQAAQQGDKQVFDVSSIASLLKATRDDSMVDRYIPDLRKALDRLGRILFSLYWHGQEFQDRFGKADMPKLEDGLRNSFEDLGDIVLQLMQKTVQSYPEEDMDVDLTNVAR